MLFCEAGTFIPRSSITRVEIFLLHSLSLSLNIGNDVKKGNGMDDMKSKKRKKEGGREKN